MHLMLGNVIDGRFLQAERTSGRRTVILARVAPDAQSPLLESTHSEMSSAPNKPPALSQGIQVPDDNKSSTAKEAAGALATVSTKLDPMPHFSLAGLSLFGSAYYSYLKKPQLQLVGWAMGAAGLGYAYSGYARVEMSGDSKDRIVLREIAQNNPPKLTLFV